MEAGREREGREREGEEREGEVKEAENQSLGEASSNCLITKEYKMPLTTAPLHSSQWTAV